MWRYSGPGSLAKYGLSKVTVSEFVNPSGRHFRSVSLARSSCEAAGDWVGGDTWYPGHRWRLCHCPVCGQPVGWQWRQWRLDSSPASQWVGLRLDKVVDWEGFLLGPLSDLSQLLTITGRK